MIPANLFESAELFSRYPRDCMVDGGSIPTQAADSVSIYPDSLDDMEQKIGSSVKGGMEQETSENTPSHNLPRIDFNDERKGRENDNDSNQQQRNVYTRIVGEWAVMLSGEAYTSPEKILRFRSSNRSIL